MTTYTTHHKATPTPSQYKIIRQDWQQRFQYDFTAYSLPFENVLELGRQNAFESDNSQSEFCRFQRWWNEQNGETPEEKELRDAAAYLRHQIMSYDAVLQACRKDWNMPAEFSVHIWSDAMEAMVTHFPQLQNAYERGLALKHDFESRNTNKSWKTYNQKMRKEKKSTFFSMLDNWHKQRSTMSRLVSPFFYVGQYVRIGRAGTIRYE